MSIADRIGPRIRSIRKEKKITQGEAAARADMSHAHWSHIETGRRVPSLQSVERIADALGVTVAALLGES